MKQLFKRLFDRTRAFRNKMDEYQETITFAEAGQARAADSARQSAKESTEPGVLLVIGNDDTFSRRIIDYALEMAQRMNYRIVALNMAPVPAAAIKLLAPSQNKLQEFEESARQNVAQFEQAAQDLGIRFTHEVKFGETDAVIEEVAREYGGVEFVVSEPAEDQAEERAVNENRPEKQVYVYTMA